MTETELELTANNEMQDVLIKHLLRVAKYDDFIVGFNEEGCDLIRTAKPDPKRAAALEAAFHHLGFEIAPR